jgi:hypothetical protein
MFKYSFLLLLLISFLSCKQQQKVAGNSLPNQDNKLIFSLKTTPCFGECPVFDLKLYSDATLVFEGKQFTELEGTHEATLNKRQYEAFINLVEQVDWEILNDEYVSDMTDLPSSQFYFINSGNPRNIYKYGTEPKSLSVLGEAILPLVENDIFGIDKN